MIMKIARALHKRTKGDKGFTLIELIVVIAVLGVLATLLIPKVVGVKSDAETAAMDANARIIKNALERYYLDNEEKYPVKLEDLVEEGYLDEIPEDFEDYYTYDPDNGDLEKN
jgi:type II secretion system protein G